MRRLFVILFISVIIVGMGIYLLVVPKTKNKDYMFYTKHLITDQGIDVWLVRDMGLHSVYMRFAFKTPLTSHNLYTKNLEHNLMVASLIQHLPNKTKAFFAKRSVQFRMHGYVQYVTGYVQFALQDRFFVQVHLKHIFSEDRFVRKHFRQEQRRLRQFYGWYKGFDSIPNTLSLHHRLLQNLPGNRNILPVLPALRRIHYWPYLAFYKYYKKNIVKDHLSVVLYGNISDSDATSLVNDFFGHLPSSAALNQDNSHATALSNPKKAQTHLIYSDLVLPMIKSEPFLFYESLPFRIKRNSYIKAQLLNTFLGKQVGLLNKIYRNQQHLTYQVQTGFGFMVNPSTYGVLQGYAYTQHPKMMRVQFQQSLEAIYKMRNKEFVQLKHQLWNTWITQFSDPSYMTQTMLNWRLMGLTPNFSITIQSTLNSITKRDLLEFGKRVFHDIVLIEGKA